MGWLPGRSFSAPASRSPSSSIGSGPARCCRFIAASTASATARRASSVDARYLAAVLACGEGALLSGRAAAHLFGLLKGSAPPPEVTTRTTRRVPGVNAPIAAARRRNDVARDPRHDRRTDPHRPRKRPPARCPGPCLPRGRGPPPHHTRARRSGARTAAEHPGRHQAAPHPARKTFASREWAPTETGPAPAARLPVERRSSPLLRWQDRRSTRCAPACAGGARTRPAPPVAPVPSMPWPRGAASPSSHPGTTCSRNYT
jgi:hypothetical protein